MQSNTEERGREGFFRFCAVREGERESGLVGIRIRCGQVPVHGAQESRG